MPYVCITLGLTCLLFSWKLYPVSPFVSLILLLTGVLAVLPTRMEVCPRIIHHTCAVVGTLLCFVSFGTFFSLTPELTIDWYLTPFANPYMGLVLGGLTAMTSISENSCCLKVDQTLLDVPECVQLASNLRRRLQEIRTA